MTMRLTPDVLSGAYDFLRITQPFHRWKLPESDDLEFRVTRHKDRFGHFWAGAKNDKPFPDISISEVHVDTGALLLATMAHEIIHLHMYLRRHKGWNAHGSKFSSLAKRVCAVHGFELSSF